MPPVADDAAAAAYDQYLALLRRDADTAQLFGLSPGFTMKDVLVQIDQLKGWVDGFRPLPPAVVSEMRWQFAVRYTYHSNALEGNTLTQSETEMVLERGLTVGGKTLAEHLEAVGHREAIGYIEDLAQRNAAIGEREVRDLHSLLLRAVDQISGTQDAGRYRTLDVRAAGTGHLYPPHYRLPELMEAFTNWLGSGEAALNRHPVAFAAEAHARFVTIHPFADGNGRTGRLLMNLLLLRHGYPIAVLTRERRTEYIDALVHAQNNAGDTEPLTALVADACRTSLIDYLRVLSTAADSRGRAFAFYKEMTAFLDSE